MVPKYSSFQEDGGKFVTVIILLNNEIVYNGPVQYGTDTWSTTTILYYNKNG